MCAREYGDERRRKGERKQVQERRKKKKKIGRTTDREQSKINFTEQPTKTHTKKQLKCTQTASGKGQNEIKKYRQIQPSNVSEIQIEFSPSRTNISEMA